VSLPTPSPPCGPRRHRARGATRALLAAAWLVAFPALGATAGVEAAGPGCGPIDPDVPMTLATVAEPGVAPSAPGRAGPGAIVPLPSAPATQHPTAEPGEALLALPKGPDGSIPTDFELAPGAAVADSFFSPVVCATVVRVVGPPDATLASLVTRLPPTALAVPNHVYLTAADTVRPLDPPPTGRPDPYASLQWGLARSGAERAWAVSDGRGARVALLDSAPDTSHRDLIGVRRVPLPGAKRSAPAVHGTLMAGVVRALANNGFGIAGIAPGADVFDVPVCRPTGAGASDECPLFDLLRGIDVAWQEHAQIVNLSLVGPPNPLLRKAMDRLEQLDVVAVAAAGNEGVSEPRYPAAYPSVVGVGAVDREGHPYVHGNRGPSVEVLAPGVEVLSTVPHDGFAFGDGTSLAAAHVTGVLALAVAAGGDPLAARTAFFAAAQARNVSPGNDPAPLPTACDVLARLGRPCH
jgi:hypothetical protein